MNWQSKECILVYQHVTVVLVSKETTCSLAKFIELHKIRKNKTVWLIHNKNENIKLFKLSYMINSFHIFQAHLWRFNNLNCSKKFIYHWKNKFLKEQRLVIAIIMIIQKWNINFAYILCSFIRSYTVVKYISNT